MEINIKRKVGLFVLPITVQRRAVVRIDNYHLN